MKFIFALIFVICFSKGVFSIGESLLDFNTFTGIIQGMAGMFDKVKTVEVDKERMMGRWFQMYKAAINFDVFRTQMFCPVAYFQENSVMGKDGFSMEEAYRVISKAGPIETYKRDVTKVGPGSFWMYTEEYFYPRQMYIIKAEPELDFVNDTDDGNTTVLIKASKKLPPYEYLIATDSNRLALMVFARDPLQFFNKYNQGVLQYLQQNKFGGPSFWNAPRPIYQGADCLWPSENEVFARRVLKNQKSRKGGINPIASQFDAVNAVQNLQNILQGQLSRK